MSIKTYPLHFEEEKLREIGDKAGKGKIKSFIHEAIDEKLKNTPIKTMKALWKDLIDELDFIIDKAKFVDIKKTNKLFEKRELLELAFNNCVEGK